MPIRKKNANGSGTIRQRKDGRWEGIYSVAAVDGGSKYIRKSIYGKTKDEVRRKLTSITCEIDEGTYVMPTQTTLSEWLRNWLDIYVKPTVKDFTYDSYFSICNNHIIPAIGNIKLKDLRTIHIQKFYNELLHQKELSGKTVKNIHGVLHKALEQAYSVGEIKANPANKCVLPKVHRPKIKPFENEDIKRFLNEIKGHKYETVYYLTLFSGLRQGEVLGLTWDCVDFNNHFLLINKQLKRTSHHKGSTYQLDLTKNGKERYIPIAPAVVEMLLKQKQWQEHCAELADDIWDNSMNLVFTDEIGNHLCHATVYNNYKRIVKNLGLDKMRFHDLRHTYAVASIESGDDIKTVQNNLGHATASFTLDVYGHVSRQMSLKSAQNMQNFINSVS